jgi:hypothetical protein
MRRTVLARCVMGAVAFVVLMVAELLLAILAFGRSAAGFVAAFSSPAGAIGFAAQVVFALFPIVQVWRR